MIMRKICNNVLVILHILFIFYQISFATIQESDFQNTLIDFFLQPYSIIIKRENVIRLMKFSLLIAMLV